ncbi:MAG: hypothetical protein ACLUNZ_05145 [Evtepia sp.]
MELRQVKGNTWVLDSWELIPFTRSTPSAAVCWTAGTWTQRVRLEDHAGTAGAEFQTGCDPVRPRATWVPHGQLRPVFQKAPEERRSIMQPGDGRRGSCQPLGIQLQSTASFVMSGPLGSTRSWAPPPVSRDPRILPFRGAGDRRSAGRGLKLCRTPGASTIGHIRRADPGRRAVSGRPPRRRGASCTTP